jgi:hypothetical protein
MGPGEALVVAGLVRQAAVEDPDELVGELPAGDVRPPRGEAVFREIEFSGDGWA